MQPNKVKALVEKTRSYRKFDNTHKISEETLIELIDLARLSASARNQQSLKYLISNQSELNTKIFECLAWAGYIKDWDGPVKEEQPSAYLVMVNDKNIATNYFCDHGIAAQSILLGATELSLGGCIIAAVNKPKLTQILNLPVHLEIIQVLALGKPIEKIVLENIQNNDYKYWRDENLVHHVPKRSLDEIIIKL